MSEQDYVNGNQRAWLTMLNECISQLGSPDPARWIAERADVVLALRSICAEFGDNDWPDDLHLRDVIEKHLARHLQATSQVSGPERTEE